MWEPQPLTPLWAFTACYRDSFTLLYVIRRRMRRWYDDDELERMGLNTLWLIFRYRAGICLTRARNLRYVYTNPSGSVVPICKCGIRICANQTHKYSSNVLAMAETCFNLSVQHVQHETLPFRKSNNELLLICSMYLGRNSSSVLLLW
jgi:hypothetical protein